MDGGLEQAAAAGVDAAREPPEESAHAAPVVCAAEAGVPADGPPAASAADVQMSEDPSPAERPGKCWPWLKARQAFRVLPLSRLMPVAPVHQAAYSLNAFHACLEMPEALHLQQPSQKADGLSIALSLRTMEPSCLQAVQDWGHWPCLFCSRMELCS